MSSTSSIISDQIKDLYAAIGRTVQEGSLGSKSSSEIFAIQPTNILKSFKLHQKNIIFTWSESGLKVFVEQGGKQSVMPLEDVEGIPKEILTSQEKAKAFLYDCNLSIPKYLEKDKFTIRLNLSGLKGGGNTIDPNTQKALLWPNGIVPFYINERTFPKGSIGYNNIIQAIQMWERENVGLQFIPCSSTNPDCLAFDIDASACFSNVGKQGGKQYIKCHLDGKSFDAGSIAHEIGHAIGLHHEHNRSDRNDFVILSKSVASDSNYTIKGVKHEAYDFDSIMHYPLTNLKKISLPYFTSLVSQETSLVGQRDHLSTGDIAAVRYLYNNAYRNSPSLRSTITQQDGAINLKRDRHQNPPSQPCCA